MISRNQKSAASSRQQNWAEWIGFVMLLGVVVGHAEARPYRSWDAYWDRAQLNAESSYWDRRLDAAISDSGNADGSYSFSESRTPVTPEQRAKAEKRREREKLIEEATGPAREKYSLAFHEWTEAIKYGSNKEQAKKGTAVTYYLQQWEIALKQAESKYGKVNSRE